VREIGRKEESKRKRERGRETLGWVCKKEGKKKREVCVSERERERKRERDV